MLLSLVSAVTLGAGCQTVEITASLAGDLARGTVRCLGAGQEVQIASYANLLVAPDALDDVNWDWFYPRGFSGAGTRLWLGPSAELTAQELWQPAPPALLTGAPLHFETRIPLRNGTLGRTVEGISYLLGGWHPAFGRPNHLPVTTYVYDISVPEGAVGFVGTEPFGRASPRRRRGRFAGRYLPVLLAPAAEVRVTEALVVFRPVGRRSGLRELRLGSGAPQETELSETVAAANALLAARGIAVQPSLLVLAPLREHLVEPFDGGLAVAARAFALLPNERLRKFHRIALWRQLFRKRILSAASRVETEADAELVADLAAVALRNDLVVNTYARREFAPELLEEFAVIPEIDALIFAPQTAYVDTYYDAIDETPRRRHLLDDFYHTRPRGKVLYEKLVDRFGAAAVAAVVEEYLRAPGDFFSLAGARLGADLRGMLSPWMGAYPKVDYSLAAASPGTGPLQLEIQANGPAAAVQEPISVEIQDAEGRVHRAARLGPGSLSVAAPGPPRYVQLDPEHRLVELHGAEDQDPRYNNRVPPRWRLLLTNIAALFAVTNEQVNVSAAFSLRRIHDVRYALNFALWRTFESYGLAAAGVYKLGRVLTPLDRTQSMSAGISVERLTTERAAFPPARQAQVSVGYNYDSRLSLYSSFAGSGLDVDAAWAVATIDAQPGTHRAASAGVGAFYIFPLDVGQGLLARVRGDIVTGDPLPQDLLRLGGRYRAGRGYELDEARGNRRALASVEYRHTLGGDTHNDLAGLLTLTRLEGALFGDAVWLPVDRVGCRQEAFFDVGYGLRFIGEALNVAPSSLAVDIGVPLSRCPDERGGRRAVTIYVDFVQSFAAF